MPSFLNSLLIIDNSYNSFKFLCFSDRIIQEMKEQIFAKNDRAIFQEIPLKERPAYRKKILQMPQIQGNQPVFFHKDYPKNDKFQYNNFKLNYGFIQNTNQPQALVFFFHGMYCHGGMSGYLASIISQHIKKVNVYAIDFKNAGFSQGDCPGYYTMQQLEDQAIKFVEQIEKKFVNKKPKLFIMGQSMGGLITFKLSVKYAWKFSGAIMFAPALKDCYEGQPYLKKLGKLMGYLCPRWKFIPQDFVGFTRYENIQYMKNEKGRYLGQHPPGTAYQLLTQMDKTDKLYQKMSIPYIIFQGGMDKSIDMFAPLDLQKAAVSKDKTTVYYKQVWHDVLVDQQIEQISVRVADWLKKRI